MKARTILISVLFFVFSCSQSEGVEVAQAEITQEKDSIQQLIDQEMKILKIQTARFDSLIEEGKASDKEWMRITSNSINKTKENIKYLEGLK